MPDMRLAYAACHSGSHVLVLGPDDERVCEIPLSPAPWMQRIRSDQERMDIAQTIARLLNEESDLCHKLGRVERGKAATLEEMKG